MKAPPLKVKAARRSLIDYLLSQNYPIAIGIKQLNSQYAADQLTPEIKLIFEQALNTNDKRVLSCQSLYRWMQKIRHPSDIVGNARGSIITYINNQNCSIAIGIKQLNSDYIADKLPTKIKFNFQQAWPTPRKRVLKAETFYRWDAQLKKRGHLMPLRRKRGTGVKPWHESALLLKQRNPKSKSAAIYKQLVTEYPSLSVHQLRRFYDLMNSEKVLNMNIKLKQTEKIKADLLAGHEVNSVAAFEKHYITRLSAIIKRLRDRGWPISSEQQHGNGIAFYSLPEGWQPKEQSLNQ